MIKGIVFDLDGTLIDTINIYAEALRSVGEKRGKNLDKEQIRKELGTSSEHTIKTFFGNVDSIEEEEIHKAWDDESGRIAGKDYTKLLFPETLEVLKELKRIGVKTAVASSVGKKALAFLIDKTGLGDLITISVSVEEVNKGKPDPAVIKEALRRINVKSDEAAVVGDMNWDMIAGKAAGCKTILVDREGKSKDVMSDMKIKNLKQLLHSIN